MAKITGRTPSSDIDLTFVQQHGELFISPSGYVERLLRHAPRGYVIAVSDQSAIGTLLYLPNVAPEDTWPRDTQRQSEGQGVNGKDVLANTTKKRC